MRIILRVSQSVRASAEMCFKIIMCATSAMKWTPKVARFIGITYLASHTYWGP